MASGPYISLIFVNYHSAWELSLALQKLYSLEPNKHLFEVIVVNNDPEEMTLLEEMKKVQPITLVHNRTNHGFAKAANQGEKYAKGLLLGFINPDTRWYKESLEKIAELFLYNKSLGIFGMTLLDTKNQYEAWSGGSFPTLWKLIKNNATPSVMQRISHERGPFEWVSGGGLFIRRTLFQKLQGFDESFFLYFEDVDLCFRAKDAGFDVRKDPFVPLTHIGGKSLVSKSLQKSYFYAAQEMYFKKHRPVFERYILRILRILFRKV